jgi:ubiquinone/menaquinone biosynthesis C-methylase UbiE
METSNDNTCLKEESAVKKWHARHAKNYKSSEDYRMQTVKKYLHQESKVLDMGCGTGDNTAQIRKLVKEVWGVDFCTEMIDEAYERYDHGNVHFAVANLKKLPFLNETFDVVYCFSTLYYIKDKQKVFQEVKRVLKPGGVFIFDYGNKHSINHYWDKVMFKVPQHNSTFFKIHNTVIKTGFDLINCNFYQLHPWTRKKVISPLQPFAFRNLMEVRKK